jgi:hypothetical protein
MTHILIIVSILLTGEILQLPSLERSDLEFLHWIHGRPIVGMRIFFCRLPPIAALISLFSYPMLSSTSKGEFILCL